MGRKLDRRRKPKPGPESIAAREGGLVITLRRREALVCQLDTAIAMWFFGYDPVTIHLLVMPAYHVLCDLGGDTGKAPNIREFVGDRIDTAYDWLRHASSDPHDIIDFPPRVNEFLMWVCIKSFAKIFGGSTAFMRSYRAFFVLWIGPTLGPAHAHLAESADAFLPEGITVGEVRKLSRIGFFDKLTEMFSAEMLRKRSV